MMSLYYDVCNICDISDALIPLPIIECPFWLKDSLLFEGFFSGVASYKFDDFPNRINQNLDPM